jgi:hypothetical protein
MRGHQVARILPLEFGCLSLSTWKHRERNTLESAPSRLLQVEGEFIKGSRESKLVHHLRLALHGWERVEGGIIHYSFQSS